MPRAASVKSKIYYVVISGINQQNISTGDVNQER